MVREMVRHHHVLALAAWADLVGNSSVIGAESFVAPVAPYQPVVLDSTIFARFGATYATNHNSLAPYARFFVAQVALV